MKSSTQTTVAEAILPIVQATSSDFRHAYAPNTSNDTKRYDFESIQYISIDLPYLRLVADYAVLPDKYTRNTRCLFARQNYVLDLSLSLAKCDK